jgi:SAM-dependent methyltransferase
MYEDEGYYKSRGGVGVDARAASLEQARGILETLGSVPSSVLDFGAGVGHLVNALRAMGIAAEGVEASTVGRAAARRLYSLELHSGLSADLSGRFQLVTLIHSLEHVVEPVATLKKIAGLLELKGAVFIEVPHAGSIEMWRPRRRREILDLPHHLYHFDPRTLFRVVECAGLRVVEVRLTNPGVVEWALGLRARWVHACANLPVSPCGLRSHSVPVKGWVKSAWRQQVLPWVRHRFPGPIFQLVATRAS